MVSAGRSTPDTVGAALTWVARRGIGVQRWPDPATAVGSLTGEVGSGSAVTAGPVLYLVEPGASPPPRWGELEDWVRLPAEADELLDRADRLLRRAARTGSAEPYVDDDDVLHVGEQIAALSTVGARLVSVLLVSPGQVVARGDAIAALWPDGPPADPRALDNRLKLLRQRLVGLPLRIHTVRGRGLLLDWSDQD